MTKKPKFKKRYVLGEGYVEFTFEKYIHLNKIRYMDAIHIKLKHPIELWERKVPKYRLVLERVKP